MDDDYLLRKHVTFTLPIRSYIILKIYAYEQGKTMSDILAELINKLKVDKTRVNEIMDEIKGTM